MIEISGRESKIEAFIERMRPYGILELVRTGRIAMVRGKNRQPKTEEEAEEQDATLKQGRRLRHRPIARSLSIRNLKSQI